MPSLIWGRDPQEAFDNPYEYDAQNQFFREASGFLALIYRLLNKEDRRYTRDERTAGKAVWLLLMDALDSLEDCLNALSGKQHRVAAKLLRDILESMNLAAYLQSDDCRKQKYLDAWYDDEVVPHRVFREYIKNIHGEQEFEESRRHYNALSKFTHRSYKAIMDGYLLGSHDFLVHDRTDMVFGDRRATSKMLVLPQTIAAYCAALANMILIFSDELVRMNIVNGHDVEIAYQDSLEVETVPRRFKLMRPFREEH